MHAWSTAPDLKIGITLACFQPAGETPTGNGEVDEMSKLFYQIFLCFLKNVVYRWKNNFEWLAASSFGSIGARTPSWFVCCSVNSFSVLGLELGISILEFWNYWHVPQQRKKNNEFTSNLFIVRDQLIPSFKFTYYCRFAQGFIILFIRFRITHIIFNLLHF